MRRNKGVKIISEESNQDPQEINRLDESGGMYTMLSRMELEQMTLT